MSGEPNQRFERMFRAAPDAMGITLDGVILEVNPAWEHLLGWSHAEAVGKTVFDIGVWTPATRAAVMDEMERTGQVNQVDVPMYRRDGRTVHCQASLRWFDLDGRRAILFSVRDVSAQRHDREALALSEARLRGLAAATFEGIAVSEGGRILDCNERLAEMLGYRRDELIGILIETLSAPETIDAVRDHVSHGRDDAYQHTGLRKDGTTLPIEVRARMLDVDGRRLRFSAVRDVSDRRRAQLEEQRLISELRARNDEMEQFVYTVSHDLKSPLVTIKGFLGTIEDDVTQGRLDLVRADLARIGNAAERMSELLDDLLELSRVGRIGTPPTPVELDEVVREAVELVEGTLRRRAVEVVIAPALPTVRADRGRLIQVFQNLIENAAKYTGTQAHPSIEIGARPDPERAVVFVRDNGLGIDPRHFERVFGLFDKLDPRSDGTGVGLALVRRIVEFHGGRIWVESAGPGQGSTFLLSLPRAQPPGASPA